MQFPSPSHAPDTPLSLDTGDLLQFQVELKPLDGGMLEFTPVFSGALL